MAYWDESAIVDFASHGKGGGIPRTAKLIERYINRRFIVVVLQPYKYTVSSQTPHVAHRGSILGQRNLHCIAVIDVVHLQTSTFNVSLRN